uniref:N-acetylglucosaminylphosphatidylinositol deacetylase n=1 Tax=Anthurium amnicola TaxID=1678845 RepID=A0A1D1XPV8_9ARAE
MSTGNADGKGYIRKEELYRVCAILKVPPQRVKVLDHPNLQDGLKEQWQHNLLATIIGEEVNMREIDKIITFDSHGISGHQNHRDVHHGLCMLLQEKRPEVEAWELISTSILRKYSGPVDIWLSIFYSLYWPHGQTCCLLNTHPRKCYLAMAEHESQWVWFRKLFVMFSSYTYVNTLRKINL